MNSSTEISWVKSHVRSAILYMQGIRSFLLSISDSMLIYKTAAHVAIDSKSTLLNRSLKMYLYYIDLLKPHFILKLMW